jgi:hypothetical protein
MKEADYPHYPGLNAQAGELWREFLSIYDTSFTSYMYNVRIGQGLRAPASATAAEAALWKSMTQKRIDVVASRKGQTWIVEVDERPGARTFGQLQLYKHMAPLYLQTEPIVIGALICRWLGYDMYGAFLKHEDLVFKLAPGYPPAVPAAFPPPGNTTKYRLINDSYGNPATLPD